MSARPVMATAAVLLTIAQVRQRYGTSDSTIARRIRAGAFPRPRYFGSQRRWRLADLEAWEATLPTEREVQP